MNGRVSYKMPFKMNRPRKESVDVFYPWRSLIKIYAKLKSENKRPGL